MVATAAKSSSARRQMDVRTPTTSAAPPAFDSNRYRKYRTLCTAASLPAPACGSRSKVGKVIGCVWCVSVCVCVSALKENDLTQISVDIQCMAVVRRDPEVKRSKVKVTRLSNALPACRVSMSTGLRRFSCSSGRRRSSLEVVACIGTILHGVNFQLQSPHSRSHRPI